jgi:hypothetical protein
MRGIAEVFDGATTVRGFGILLLVAAGAGCRQDPAPGISFEEITRDSGIGYVGPTWGAAWRDFDLDGNVDVAISLHFSAKKERRTPLALFRNLGNGHFVDAGALLPAGLSRDLHGGAWADFDNDGDADLLLSAGGDSGRAKSGLAGSPITTNLFLVQEDGAFRDAAGAFGLAAPRQRGRRPTWMDIDLDARLDVVFAQATPDTPQDIAYRQTAGRFEPCPAPFPGLGNKDSTRIAIPFRGFSDDARYLVFQGNAAPGKLYRIDNAADCRFDLVTDETISRGTRDLLLADLTGDLSLDYFAPTAGHQAFERQGSPNTLVFGLPGKQPLTEIEFRTHGPVSFVVRPATGPHGWAKRESPEIFIGAEGRHPETYQFTLDPDDASLHGALDTAKASDGCFIHYETGSDSWKIRVKKTRWRTISVVVSSESPIERTSDDITADDAKWGQSDVFLVQGEDGWVPPEQNHWFGALKTSCATAVAGDYDNDMDLDLFLGCADSRGSQPNVLLENRGDHFTAVPPPGAVGGLTGILESVTSADVDNDGFLDLMITYGGASNAEEHGPVRLYRNRGNANNWLKIDLEGSRNARDAFGARVFVKAGGRTQARQHADGGHGSGQNEQVLHFGLAGNRSVEEVLVDWPDGGLEYFHDVPINARTTLKEGQGEALAEPAIMTASAEVSRGSEVHFLALLPRRFSRTSIRWDFGEGPALQGRQSVRHRFEHKGTARAKITATTSDGKKAEAVRSVLIR